MSDPVQQAKDWTELMFRIGRKELWVFEGNNVAYAENLIETNCRRLLMRWIYHTLVGYKKVVPIEGLELSQQEDITMFVEDVCKGREVSEQVKNEIGMTFYTLEYFINEK